jgi:hypothetical protein
MIALWKRKNPIYFGVIRSKVKVTVTMNIIFDNRQGLYGSWNPGKVMDFYFVK